MGDSGAGRRAARAAVGLLLLLACAPGVARAGDLTVSDLLELKQVGFSDAEIWREVETAPTKPVLTDADASRLEAAGFAEDFIARLRGAGASLTLAAIETLHRDGQDAAAILRRIAAAHARPALDPADALRLKKAGVPTAVLRGLAGDPLEFGELLRLAREGAGGDALAALVDLVGTSFVPDADQALRLVRGGVYPGTVRRLRDGARSVYAHPNGRFALRPPAGWRRVARPLERDYAVLYLFTPDRVSDPGKARRGFSVTPRVLDPTSSLAVVGIEEVLRRLMPALLAEAPGLAVRAGTDVETGRLGGQEAAFVQLEGPRHLHGDEVFRSHVGVARKDGFLFVVAAHAPLEEYEDLADTFGKCADTLRLGRPDPARGGAQRTPQQWSEGYKDSVVMVQALTERGSSNGTGFIVREDGHVLTNHHVVWDEARNRPCEEFRVHWDSSLGREPVRATLVGWKRSRLRRRGAKDRIDEWGADTALLKIEAPGTYRAMPIAPMAASALSDPVLTLGFPLSGSTFDLRSLSVFATRGTVVRFNRQVSGEVDSIYTDAQFTHGNSGGPCVNLALGAVVGQNTFGYGGLGEGLSRDLRAMLNDLSGYRGVTPIDHALEEWPDILRLRPGYDRGWTAHDHVLLAVDFAAEGSIAAAVRQLDRAVELEPRHVEAHVLRAACALRSGEPETCRVGLETALGLDPEHAAALALLAQLHAEAGEVAEAAQYADRAVEARPDSMAPYVARAGILHAVGRHGDALRDADRAARIAQGLDPAPDVLAGRILYAMGRLEEGRDRMQAACEAAPHDLDALLGHASYFERKGMWQAAVVEYAKAQGRLPSAPELDRALGRCYLELDDPDRAWKAYWAARQKCRDAGRDASETTYAGLCRVAFDMKGDLNASLGVMVDYANTWLDSPEAHVRLAELHVKAGKHPGLAYAHAILARMAAEDDPEVLRRVGAIPEAPLRIEDVTAMERMGYWDSALAVVRVAPLGFTIDREKLQRLDAEISPLLRTLLDRILRRQERGATGSAAAQGGADIWEDPGGAMRVRIPAAFRPLPEVTERFRQGGQPWAALVLQAPETNTVMMLLTFEPGAGSAHDVITTMHDCDRRAGHTLQTKSYLDVSFGALKGVMTEGTCETQDGAMWSWQVVVARTRAGVRGIRITWPSENDARTAELRRSILQGLRIAEPDDGSAGVWRDAAGAVSVEIPAAFEADAAVVKRFREEGLGAVAHFARDARSGMFVMIWAFDPATTDVRDALASIRRYEKASGATMEARDERELALGPATCLLTGGWLTIEGKQQLAWEALLVPTAAGVRAVFFTVARERYDETADLRKSVYRGLRLLRAPGNDGRSGR